MDEQTIMQVEQAMAQLIQQNSPEDVREFIDAISADGVTQDEVMEFKQETLNAINNPQQFRRYTQYLLSTGLVEQADLPPSYDANFLFVMLGMGAIAQTMVNA
jgi:hypothetical protein